jgi:hypothetical protein
MQPDYSAEIALLDRIQRVLDNAVGEKGTKGPSVNIDRGLVDELRADVTQVKMDLQGQKK